MPAVSAPAIHKWKIGKFTVTRVLEFDTLVIPPGTMLKATAEDVKRHQWLAPIFATEAGELLVHIQAFIIDTGDLRIMVDPCVGNAKPRGGAPPFHMLDNPFLDYLGQAGYPAESIDVVLCTHLHLDHVGWNTSLENGKWVPTFPNAQYLFARVEYEHTRDDSRLEAVSDESFQDSVQPIVEAGQARLIEFDERICDGVSLEPTPGHTPGHCCIRLRSCGAEAVITGDMIHHAVQAADPEIVSTFCFDEDQARATRKAFLERCADSGATVLGTHFANPTAVTIHRHGAGAYRFAAAFDRAD